MLKISKKKALSKVLAIALSLVMTVSLGATSAFAVDTDPNMTAKSGSNFITPVDSTSLPGTVIFQAVPANAKFIPTFFSTQAGAQNVAWSLAGESGNINVELIGNDLAVVFNFDQWFSQQTAMVLAPTNGSNGQGAASIRATNPASSPTANEGVDFTVVSSDPANSDNGSQTVDNVTVLVIDPAAVPADPTNTPFSGVFTVSSAANTIDARSYVTVLDSIKTAGTGNNAIVSNVLTELRSTVPQNGAFLASMEINGVNPAVTNPDPDAGWQYRTYTLVNGVLTLNDASDALGAGDYMLQGGETILWQFGLFGAVVFPPTLD